MIENKLSILYVGKSAGVANQLNLPDDIVVISCSNEQEAKNALVKGPLPDAILCEYLLPDWNGIELHEQLRGNPAFGQIAFILLSQEFDEDIFKTAFFNRIDDFFVVPLPPAKSLIGRLRFLKDYRQKYRVPKPGPEPETSLEDIFVMPVSKRIFDLIVAWCALLFLLPILFLSALAISVESKGKVFYTSKRFGRGRIFDLYKFQTMRIGSSAEMRNANNGFTQHIADQKSRAVNFAIPCPRCAVLPDGEKCSPILYRDQGGICESWYLEQKHNIALTKSKYKNSLYDLYFTKVGKFLRITGIDKWPQLINVIKGDMSIVGNNPLPLYEVERVMDDEFAKRFLAPAGIISLWQVEERAAGRTVSAKERQLLDNAYSDHFIHENYSIMYDLALIFRMIR